MKTIKQYLSSLRFVIASILLVSAIFALPVILGRQVPTGTQLVAPPFLNIAEAQSGSLLTSAGISAYAEFGQPIDLDAIESRDLIRISQKTDTYILGLITPRGYEPNDPNVEYDSSSRDQLDLNSLDENFDVHILIHSDGWIVAYLLQTQDASSIIDWVNYDVEKLGQNTLSSSIKTISNSISNPINDEAIGYYDFRFKEANKIVIAADEEPRGREIDGFQLNISDGTIVYDVTWSHGHAGITTSKAWLNNDSDSPFSEHSECNCWAVNTGNFTDKFSPGNSYSFSVENSNPYNSSYQVNYIGAVLIIQE